MSSYNQPFVDKDALHKGLNSLSGRAKLVRIGDSSLMSNKKRRPTHPGEVLREDILPAARLTQTELAKRLKVSRRTVNEICQERRSVSADMANRLARIFNTTPEVWMNMQSAVDIWDALEANRAEYQGIKPLRLAKS